MCHYLFCNPTKLYESDVITYASTQDCLLSLAGVSTVTRILPLRTPGLEDSQNLTLMMVASCWQARFCHIIQ